MSVEFSSKQPYEAYSISFDFTSVLGAETIASATITAVDEVSLADVSTTLLDVTKQTDITSTPVVYGWIQAGTSGHSYLITCRIVGSLGSLYELEAIQPVTETPIMSSSGGTRCVIEPTLEPVTLAELRTHLGIDSGTIATDLIPYTSIASGSHGIVAAYTLLGTAVNVLGHTAVVYLTPVNNGAGGTVDVKIQEADVLAGPYTDWSTGVFTQVTEANDTVIQEIAYTGSKKYIRTVAKTLGAACEFGTSIMVWEPNVSEDDMLNELIVTAREYVESVTSRQIITATWDYCLDEWPCGDSIKLPWGCLQSVVSVIWKSTDGTETTLTPTTDYLVEDNGDQCGRIVLPYQGCWPSGELFPSNPITIRYICGWTSAAAVPSRIKSAIKRVCVNLYANRGDDVIGQTVVYDKTVERLLSNARLWDMF